MTQPVPPRQVRWAIVATCVVAAVHVAALILIAQHVDVIRGALSAAHPTASATQVNALTRSQVLNSVVPHVVLAIVLPWRAYRLLSGRRSARVVLTALLAVQLAAHATLPMVLAVLPGYAGWVIAVQGFSLVFEVAALGLLWGRHGCARFSARLPRRRCPPSRNQPRPAQLSGSTPMSGKSPPQTALTPQVHGVVTIKGGPGIREPAAHAEP